MLLPLQFPPEQRLAGQLKLAPEDFVVSELYQQQPEQSAQGGEWTILEVVKRDLSTPALVGRLAELLGLPRQQISCAGHKDRKAITRQRLSLPHHCWPFPLPDWPELLEVNYLGRQAEPLRPGQLLANRFQLCLRQVDFPQRLPELWQRQEEVGFANYFGVQRFGHSQQNWEQGLAQLRQPPPRRQCRRWPHNFEISAVQSHLFNQFLEGRIASGQFLTLQSGDWYSTSEGLRQAQGGEPSHQGLGPIWGYKLEQPSAGEIKILESWDLQPRNFYPFRAPGSRRRLRLPLPPLELQRDGNDLLLGFELPPGVYATVLLEHFLQPCSFAAGALA